MTWLEFNSGGPARTVQIGGKKRLYLQLGRRETAVVERFERLRRLGLITGPNDNVMNCVINYDISPANFKDNRGCAVKHR